MRALFLQIHRCLHYPNVYAYKALPFGLEQINLVDETNRRMMCVIFTIALTCSILLDFNLTNRNLGFKQYSQNQLISVEVENSKMKYSQKFVEDVLAHRLDTQAASTLQMENHISQLAGYYSNHPAVYYLLSFLEKHPWQITLTDGAFRTEIFGSEDGIGLARIHFNPNRAGQLQFNAACNASPKLCLASPADLLLHELLHVMVVFKNPTPFLKQFYKSNANKQQHEQLVIQLEQNLFRVMTASDDTPRPFRFEHLGQSHWVSCPTCLN